MQKVVIFGAQGLIGQEMLRAMAAKGDAFETIPLGSFNYDLARASEVRRAFEELKPEIIINCAAYSDVDECERPKLAELVEFINAKAPEEMAKMSKKTGATLLHLSTDFVFDGTRESYSEADIPNPLNYYGKSKLLGEQLVAASCPAALIIRTARVYGSGRQNFVTLTDSLAKQRKPINAITDEWGNYTWAADLAERIAELLIQKNELSGILHLAGNELASPYEIAKEIISLRKSSSELVGISTTTLKRPALRPSRVILVSERTPLLPGYRDSLSRFLGISLAVAE